MWKVAVDVRAEREIEMLFGDVVDRLRMLLKGGVVHEDVERAELVDGALHGIGAEVGILHVAGNQQAVAILLFLDDVDLPRHFPLLRNNRVFRSGHGRLSSTRCDCAAEPGYGSFSAVRMVRSSTGGGIGFSSVRIDDGNG
jgi:hypothetical protein